MGLFIIAIGSGFIDGAQSLRINFIRSRIFDYGPQIKIGISFAKVNDFEKIRFIQKRALVAS
jgi:hypothetical protein